MTNGRTQVSSVFPPVVRRLLGNRQAHRFLAVFAALAVVFVFVQVYLLVTWGREQEGRAVRGVRVTGRPHAHTSSSSPAPEIRRRGKPSFDAIAGVHPSKRHLYQPRSDGLFTCIESGTEIPFDHVNDDYCDCPEDGSDEPSTGACPNFAFHCTVSSVTNLRASVPASRVNDGVCDCCDGSDEWQTPPLPRDVVLEQAVQKKLGKYLAPCPYICW